MFSFASALPGAVQTGQPESGSVKGRFRVQKSDDDKRLAFGWAYVAQDEAGNQTTDWSGDFYLEVKNDQWARIVEYYNSLSK